jgi:hypothetical protein
MRIVIRGAALLFTTGLAWAQEDTIPQKRLQAPATVAGFVGGESHDSYAIRLERGRTLSVRISWERSAGNRAEFTVSESPDFFEGAPVTFGSASDRGRPWSGKVPGTGDYYIYVVAHPAAHYTLRVTASQVQNAR